VRYGELKHCFWLAMALLLRGKLNAFLGQLHCYCKVCKKVQKQKGIVNAVVEDREADRKE